MVCPDCGTTTSAATGRCASCNGILDRHAPPQVAAGLLTPVPLSPSENEEVTRLAAEAGTLPVPQVTASGGSTRSSGTHAAGLTRPGMGAADSPLAAGQSFGTRYHIIRLLGVGGMGAVYQAWDDELGVAVAIKVIRPEIAGRSSGSCGTRAALQARAPARAPGHAQATSSAFTISARSTASSTSRCRYIQGQDLATILKHVGRLPMPARSRSRSRSSPACRRLTKPAWSIATSSRPTSWSTTRARGDHGFRHRARRGRRRQHGAAGRSSARSNTWRPSRRAARRSIIVRTSVRPRFDRLRHAGGPPPRRAQTASSPS